MRRVATLSLFLVCGLSCSSAGPRGGGSGGSGGEGGEPDPDTGGSGGAAVTGGKSGTGGAAVPTGDGGSMAGAGGAPSGGSGGASTGGSKGDSGGSGGGAGGAMTTGGPLGGGNPMSTGFDRHDALYCGEWQKTTKPGDTIYLVKGGKVVWSYSLTTSGGNEYGDCTLTSYGTVFYPLKNSGAFEMKVDLTKGKGDAGDLVWQYKEDVGSEVHSVQPIGKDKAMVMQNGTPAKLMIIDKTKAKVCSSGMDCIIKTFNPDSGGTVHGMFRHVRYLANGNLLVPYTGGNTPSKGHVKEYTPDWKVVWDYDSGGSPWAAVRLHNGNTLISGNGGGWVREVSPDLKVVWEVTKADFPATMYLAQGAQRLANGNTLISNWCGPAATGEWANTVQYFEVTPDKKFVWQLKQWNNPNLGPGSSIQALDEAGVPENPGELQR